MTCAALQEQSSLLIATCMIAPWSDTTPFSMTIGVHDLPRPIVETPAKADAGTCCIGVDGAAPDPSAGTAPSGVAPATGSAGTTPSAATASAYSCAHAGAPERGSAT